MATPPSGWKPSASGNANVYETTLGTAGSSSGNAKLIMETNYTNGSYTVYREGLAGTRIPLYTQNPSSSEPSILNQAEYDKINQNALKGFNGAAKQSSYQLNQTLGTPEQKQAVNNSNYYKSLSNTSSTGPNASNQYSGYKATDTEASGIASKYTKDILQYPFNMGNNHDKIRFTAVEIEKGGLTKPSTNSLSSFAPPKNSFKKVDKSIFLGIQGSIQDQNTVSWGEGTLSAVEAFLFNTARSAMGDMGGALENAMSQLTAAAEEGQGEIGDYLAGQAAGVTNILSRTKAKILNPNLELLFQGPQLRPFNFQFKLNARTPEEAEAIKYIIKYFKRHMAVRKDTSRLFLKAPHVFTIQYIKAGYSDLHPSINLISPQTDGENTKACALQAFTVDYTPLGSYMTLNDTTFTMVSYNLALQFQEIEPIYDTDYTQATIGSGHPIGF